MPGPVFSLQCSRTRGNKEEAGSKVTGSGLDSDLPGTEPTLGPPPHPTPQLPATASPDAKMEELFGGCLVKPSLSIPCHLGQEERDFKSN